MKLSITFKQLVKAGTKSSLPRDLSSAAIYIHWPYCQRRCAYCNFNKYIDKLVDHKRMRSCLIREAETLIAMSGIQTVSSVFFGGGTPSLAEPLTIAAVMDSIRAQVNLAKDTEVSLEANPTSVETGKLKEFRSAGINRVSVGIQTLNKEGLKVLGRDHSACDSLRCLDEAKHLFPGAVSVDLMFGWPGQSIDMWMSELEQILRCCDNHISLYELTLERGTEIFKLVHSQNATLPEHHVIDDMYLRAVQPMVISAETAWLHHFGSVWAESEVLAEYGFKRYEVSNFARKERYSAQNLSYWSCQQYIGVGPGAHGRFQPHNQELREARIQTLEPNDWMWEVENYGHATRKTTPLSVLQQLEELLIVSLRTKWGITEEMWELVCPQMELKSVPLANGRVQSHIKQGLLIMDERSMRASSEGMNIIDSLVPDLLVELEQSYMSHVGTKPVR